MTHHEYPNLRRLFLQWMLVERLVLLSKAEDFFKEITSFVDFGDDIDGEKDFNVFIDYCKKSLNYINLNMKKHLFVGYDRKFEYIGIYNTKSDKIAQMATKLSAEKFYSFKKIIDLAKRSQNHEFSLIEIEHDLSGSKVQSQSFINELVENEWLFINPLSKNFCLGPRALLELSEYLKDSNNENNLGYMECNICSSLIACGSSISCNNQSCSSCYHSLCLKEYSNAAQKFECLNCKNNLN